MPTLEDAREARRAARDVLDWLQSHLDGLFLMSFDKQRR